MGRACEMRHEQSVTIKVVIINLYTVEPPIK